MNYLWTEDTGAGLHFWNLVNQIFFDDKLIVESKKSNQGILDAVSNLELKKEDKYILHLIILWIIRIFVINIVY